jgi:hypothetical protein
MRDLAAAVDAVEVDDELYAHADLVPDHVVRQFDTALGDARR